MDGIKLYLSEVGWVMVRASGTEFFFSSRRRHTRWPRDWSSDVCSSDLLLAVGVDDESRDRGVRPRHGAELEVGAHDGREQPGPDDVVGLGAEVHRERAREENRVGGRSEERRVGKEGRRGRGRYA